jgi:saccharopine dehydrogenase (NAD+, L-lysine-forming)
MKFDFVVLGATGMQGRIVVRDLLENNYSVLLCGRDKSVVIGLLKKHKKSEFRKIDATKMDTIEKAIMYSETNVVVNCMEEDWNYKVFELCAKLGVNCLDLGSSIPPTKKQFALNERMKKKKISGITGVGSVPGIGNVMLAHASKKFDTIESISLGFAWDSNIKEFVVPFSMKSILSEFTAPAPVVKNGKLKYFTPLKSIRRQYHRFIGREKEIFVRHPEQFTFLHYFKSKGLKNIKFYAGNPDHSFSMIYNLIRLGFANTEPIDYFGTKIIPIDFLTKMLKKLEMPKGYTEKENLWVRITGKRNHKKITILMEAFVPSLK